MSDSVQPPMSKVCYSLLRMFYIHNHNDVFVDTVMSIVDAFPIADAQSWVDGLIAEIESLPLLGPQQPQKTTYVVETLRLRLQAIRDKVEAGLPPF